MQDKGLRALAAVQAMFTEPKPLPPAHRDTIREFICSGTLTGVSPTTVFTAGLLPVFRVFPESDGGEVLEEYKPVPPPPVRVWLGGSAVSVGSLLPPPSVPPGLMGPAFLRPLPSPALVPTLIKLGARCVRARVCVCLYCVCELACVCARPRVYVCA